MITRQDYMKDSEALHHQYYLQFATQPLYAVVKTRLLARALKSENPYFNDIPLIEWSCLHEARSVYLNFDKIKEATGKRASSIADIVCVAKAVAKELVKLHNEGKINGDI